MGDSNPGPQPFPSRRYHCATTSWAHSGHFLGGKGTSKAIAGWARTLYVKGLHNHTRGAQSSGKSNTMRNLAKFGAHWQHAETGRVHGRRQRRRRHRHAGKRGYAGSCRLQTFRLGPCRPSSRLFRSERTASTLRAQVRCHKLFDRRATRRRTRLKARRLDRVNSNNVFSWDYIADPAIDTTKALRACGGEFF